MALQDRSYEEAFDTDNPLLPLRTGLDYRPRSEIRDFELSAEVAAQVAQRLDRVDRYHQRFDLKIQGWLGG